MDNSGLKLHGLSGQSFFEKHEIILTLTDKKRYNLAKKVKTPTSINRRMYYDS